jgi:hypothetical protein
MRSNDRHEYKSTGTPADTGGSAAEARHGAETGLQRLHDNRDVLEDIADSDLPCAWVADALLDAVDDRGESSR